MLAPFAFPPLVLPPFMFLPFSVPLFLRPLVLPPLMFPVPLFLRPTLLLFPVALALAKRTATILIVEIYRYHMANWHWSSVSGLRQCH
ncbi:MAG TPA: hypothetical protein VGM32_13585 [Rhodopila sp.]